MSAVPVTFRVLLEVSVRMGRAAPIPAAASGVCVRASWREQRHSS